MKIVLLISFKNEIGDQACSECSEPGTVAVVGDNGRTSCCELQTSQNCTVLSMASSSKLVGMVPLQGKQICWAQ